MGKIRVEQLAQMMGIANQDLIFKLKSIGLRLDEENPMIDSEMIAAVLQGKSLRHPREVILRDAESKASAPVQRPRPPQRRMPIATRRPPRRRTIIQRVEPRIKTIPTTEKPAAKTPAAADAPPASAQPTARQAPPGSAPARPGERRTERDRKSKRPARKPEVAGPREEDLRALKGSVTDVESAAEQAEATQRAATSRRKRRAERQVRTTSSGTVLEFKEGAPDGEVTVSEGMTVREFADKLGVKAKDLIKALFQRGIIVNINQVLEPELAVQVAEDLGLDAVVVSFEEEVQLIQQEQLETGEGTDTRAPVVTIMGHVDHGKTTLLDAIRSSKITEGEFGGITQHIGAYQVGGGEDKVVFLDTPGHEAFTLMRARGAQVTDIVVLVVAADDGVMPQTREAINHARAAEVPILVAINKIDKAGVNLDRVKKELADNGLAVEDWGGDVVAVEVSALKGQGLDTLLEMIQLTAELLDLKADPALPAQGVVIEARKEIGRGIVATVLVQQGSLQVGDVFVSGAVLGRVRSMMDDRGERVDVAEPATPVEVTGFDSVPEAGDPFQVVEDESKARSIAEFRRQELRARELAPAHSKVSLEKLFSQIQEGEVKELPLVIKADVQGSVEVLRDTVQKLATDKVGINIVHAGVGAITTNDVILASASNAIVVGFNVRPEKKASDLAAKEQVEMRLHTVIYELSDEIKKAMTGLLEPIFREVSRGRAEVREVFKIPRFGSVAGCHVIEGVVPKSAKVRLLRDNVVVHEGAIGSLRRFKEDVSEVRTGYDCGIRLERFQDVKPGDVIEAYGREEVAATL